MMKSFKAYSALALTFLLSGSALAACLANIPTMNRVQNMMQTMGYPLAFIMMLYMGLKWMTAETPSDRENARRGVIYIVIGVILLRVANQVILYLLSRVY